MVPHMMRVAAVLVVAVAVLSGCTEATVDPNPKPVPPTSSAPSTSRATAVPRALSVPAPVEGEVTRAVVVQYDAVPPAVTSAYAAVVPE